MSRHVEKLAEVSSTARGAKRVADIVSALTPPPHTQASSDFVAGDDAPAAPASAAVVKVEQKPSVDKVAFALAPGFVGAGIGALVWKQHRVLGALVGHAVGDNVYSLVRAEGFERRQAICQLGVEGAGIVGALVWKNHPIFGWLLGVGAGAAASMIPGSPINKWKTVSKIVRGRVPH